ncbi:MAG: FtsX-like permease family protein, partial [Clostridia bacterium]|nr:FtsX-like permease family protein [Clostridia bacterium]
FVKERTDIGILKSLGFTAGGLRVQFALRFMIIAVIGSLIGAVASMFLTMPLLEALLRILGLTRIDASISFTTFIIPAAAIWLSFFVFAYIAARKIKKIEVRELISE